MTDIFGIAKRLLIACNDRTCNDITCNDRIVLLFLPVKFSTLKIVDKLRKRKIAWKYKYVSTIEIYTCFNSIFVTNIVPASLIHIPYMSKVLILYPALGCPIRIFRIYWNKEIYYSYTTTINIRTCTSWNKINWTDQRNIILSNDSCSKKRSWEFV